MWFQSHTWLCKSLLKAPRLSSTLEQYGNVSGLPARDSYPTRPSNLSLPHPHPFWDPGFPQQTFETMSYHFTERIKKPKNHQCLWYAVVSAQNTLHRVKFYFSDLTHQFKYHEICQNFLGFPAFFFLSSHTKCIGTFITVLNKSYRDYLFLCLTPCPDLECSGQGYHPQFRNF